MAEKTHYSALHKQRARRNFITLIALLALAAVVTTLSLAKIRASGTAQAYDHIVRPELAPLPESSEDSAK